MTVYCEKSYLKFLSKSDLLITQPFLIVFGQVALCIVFSGYHNDNVFGCIKYTYLCSGYKKITQGSIISKRL